MVNVILRANCNCSFVSQYALNAIDNFDQIAGVNLQKPASIEPVRRVPSLHFSLLNHFHFQCGYQVSVVEDPLEVSYTLDIIPYN